MRWPINFLAPKDGDFRIANHSEVAPRGPYVSPQLVRSDAGIWLATLNDVQVYGDDRIAEWFKIRANLMGRTGKILVPVIGRYRPEPSGADYTAKPHFDGTFFSDGTGYVDRVIDVVLAQSAALRATQVVVTAISAGEFKSGHLFTVGNRLYEINGVTQGTTLDINPPLRAAAASGARLEFDDPECLMRLATDREMDIHIELGIHAAKTVNFIEA